MSRQQPKIRISNILLMLACFFVVVWLAFLVNLHLAVWHAARQVSRDNPNLELLPRPLPDVSLAELTGPRIEQFGFSFQAPWKSICQERNATIATVISFAGGGTLVVFDPSAQHDRPLIGRLPAAQERRITAGLFGPRALRSNYDLMAAELEATPAKVKWWASRASNARYIALLKFKSSRLTGTSPAIYVLQTAGLRGFQFGDPAVKPYRVRLDLFDGNDRHYQIFLSSNGGPHQVLSQAQVNAVVNSIEPSPSTSASEPSK